MPRVFCARRVLNAYTLESLRAPALAQLVQEVLGTLGDDLRSGAVVTVKARKSTCHRLPIGNAFESTK